MTSKVRAPHTRAQRATADAITRDRHLVLLPLPSDIRAEIDRRLPPRWGFAVMTCS